jgi:hypothetical protein
MLNNIGKNRRKTEGRWSEKPRRVNPCIVQRGFSEVSETSE